MDRIDQNTVYTQRSDPSCNPILDTWVRFVVGHNLDSNREEDSNKSGRQDIQEMCDML